MSRRTTGSPSQGQIGFDFEAEDPRPAEPPDGRIGAIELLDHLEAWAEAGWLRALDVALARWLLRECPNVAPEVLLLAALLSQAEGHGHGALRLSDGVEAAKPGGGLAGEDGLDGPAAAQAALAALRARCAPQRADGLAALRACEAVYEHGAGEVPNPGVQTRPLVLDHGLLYLRRHWVEERAIAWAVRARVAAPDDEHPDPHRVRAWLDRLFPAPPEPDPGSAAPDWQRVACAVALRGRLTLITGGPGTGKTYTVARLLALQFALHPDARQWRVSLAAPTGKAAARLKQAIDQALDELGALLPDALDWALLRDRLKAALTLHKLLGARPDTRRLRHHAGQPLEVDLLVVDEASMVHLEMMAALLDALPARARLVLLGDRDQLASVEAGSVLGDLCGTDDPVADAATRDWVQACSGEAIPAQDPPSGPLANQTVMLRRSRRFQGDIGTLARAVNAGDAAGARRVLQASSTRARAAVVCQAPAQLDDVLTAALFGTVQPQDAADRADGLLDSLALLHDRPAASDGADAYEAWVRKVLAAFDRQRVLCALRDGDWGVMGVNRRIEAALRARGLIARTGAWYEGRPVMVTRNDAALGVFNGDLGLALRAPGADAALRVWFQDGERLRSVLASRLSAIETAYAMTVHKSQGSEFAHTLLVLPPRSSSVLTRELVYTGITRARERFTLLAPALDVLETALQHRTARVSGLARRLRDTD